MSDTYVSSGTVSTTTVSSGSTLYVLSSGRTEFTTVLSGGTQFVYDGGVASFTSVDDGGFLFVSAGGTAQGGAINSGGDAYIAAGGAAYGALVAAAGELDVIGGTASGINVSGGRMFVQSGGEATDTKVQSGGAMYVSAGGSAGLTEVYVSSLLYVGYDGAASSTTILSGGEDYVGYGYQSATTVDASGLLSVGFEGTASDNTINTGGVAEVASGGVLSGAIVASGAALFNSGTAANVTVVAGGYEVLADAARQSGSTIAGVEVVAGQDSFTTVGSGGALFVDGGIEISADVDSGGFLSVFGSGGIVGEATASILSGGVALVGPNGEFSGDLASGATLIVADKSLAVVTASPGSHVISTGVAIISYPGVIVNVAQSINGQTLGKTDEIVYVLSKGMANNVTINGPALEEVFSGGSANNDIVNLGTMDVYGGVVSGTTILGGTGYISGGAMYGTTIGSGGGNYGFLTLVEGVTSGSKVYAGGDEVIYGGTAQGTTIESGGEIETGGEQDIYGSLATAAGAVIFNGGIEFAISGGVASNTTIDGGALNLVSGGAAYGGIHFTNSDGILFIESTDLPSTTISGFGAGDSIELTDLTYSSSDQVAVGTPGIVTISVAGTHYDLNIAGAASNTPYYLVAGAEDTGLVLLDSANAPCFAAGTRILTPRGEIAVEKLVVGDMVITRSGEDGPIIWIGRRRIDLTRHPHPEQARPIRISADALDDGVPRRDLLLSPDHALFINGALIPAKALLNDRNVVQLSPQTITYFHIELAAHNVIFAENCAVETYLETGNRGAFANAAGALTLHPDFAQTLREQKSCAPFTESGPILDAAREQTMRRHYEMRRKGSSAF